MEDKLKDKTFNIEKAIERHKTKLLDISRRNQLLNFRYFKRSTIKVVDEIPSEIFKDMVINGRKFDFLHMINDEEDHELDISLESVEHHSYDETNLPEKHTDTSLQTDQNLKDLLLSLRNIESKSREFLDEKGINVLFLALGMLKWQDEKSRINNLAPIILIPVELSKKSAKAKYYLRYTGDEILINPAIQYKLNTDYNITLDDIEIDDEFKLVDYFEEFKETISDRNDWKILNDIGLGLFAFNKFVMYKDADKYPSIYKSNPLVRATWGDQGNIKRSSENHYPQAEELDEKIEPEKTYQILDADSSQQEAIEAVKAGNDIIIQGPPGTGKSQTISNLIGELIGNNKTVLFVCEKMPALTVVYSRLKKLGLSTFCLEMHSDKKNRKYFIEQLKNALDFEAKSKMNHRFIHHLKEKRKALTEYSKTLHTKDKVFGKTPFWVIGKLVHGKKHGFLRDLSINVENYDHNKLVEHTSAISDLKKDYDRFGNLLDHPFYGIGITSTGEIIRTEIEEILLKSDELFELLLDRLSTICNKVDIEIDDFDSIRSYLELFEIFKDQPELSEELYDQDDLKALNAQFGFVIPQIKIVNELEQKTLQNYDSTVFEINNEKIKNELDSRYSNFFKYLKPSYYKFVKGINNYLRNDSGLHKSSLFNQYSNISDLLNDLNDIKINQSKMDEIESYYLKGMLGSLWRNKETNIQHVQSAIEWRERFDSKLLNESDRTKLKGYAFKKVKNFDIVSLSHELNDIAFKQLLPSIDDLNETAKISENIFYSGALKTASLVVIHEKINEFLENFIDLVDWKNFNLRYLKLQELNLKEVVENLLINRMDPIEYSKKFERTILLNLFEALKNRNKILRDFEADIHRDIENQFKEYDKQLMEYAKFEILYNLYLKMPHSDPDYKPTAGGDFGYIQKQLLAKRGGHSVRKIFEKQAAMIQSILPCFMMSPLSACQYVNPEKVIFDYVIFDEASQITPEDSVSSIVRGKKVVIAGDTKQLPPTPYFKNVGSIDTDDDDDEIVEFDSILDVANAVGITEKTLRWHYRSKHESLITFSNINFYRNQLNTFPSPHNSSEHFGISAIFVDGYYDRTKTKTIVENGEKKRITTGSATNKNEAKAIADAVYEHYKHFDDKSLGIGAFSQRQQKAIKDCIEELRLQNYDFDQWCNSGPDNASDEKLFIKNLETIQGDERDVIFISMGYAKDKDGILRMGFGPLNQKGGERRLNVLVTRAKEKIRFFTSIKSSDFDLSKTNSRGAKLLHQYLKFAESNGDETTLENPFEFSANIDEDNIFQQSVYAELVEAGYDCVQEVGQAGYRIDIAIIDPNDRSRFLLAVECDGATYHSSATARDRDRLRQSVLENLGWRFHRIWSTDWFQNHQSEMKKLENAIHGITSTRNENIQVKSAEMIDYSHSKPKKSDITVIPYITTAIFVVGNDDDLYNAFKYDPKKVREIIFSIIDVESPVHISTIGERFRTAYGIGQIGTYIAKKIKDNADAVARDSQMMIVKSSDFSSANSTFYIKYPIRKIIRTRELPKSVRDFNHIHFYEILFAILFILDNEKRIDEESMFFKIRELFGFKSSGSKIKKRITGCLNQALKDGYLKFESSMFVKGDKSLEKVNFEKLQHS